MPRILVDADACPVKEEIYKVAFRRSVPVVIVSNQHIRIPAHELISRVVVSDGFDAADGNHHRAVALAHHVEQCCPVPAGG